MPAKLYALLLLLLLNKHVAHGQTTTYVQDSTAINASLTDKPDGHIYALAVNDRHRVAPADDADAGLTENYLHGITPPYHDRGLLEEYRKRLNDVPPLQERMQIKITPSSLADPWGGMLPVAVEYNFGKHFGIEVMAAIPLYTYYLGYRFNDLNNVVVKKDAKYAITFLHYIHNWEQGHLYMAIEAVYRHEVLGIGHGEIDLGPNGDYDKYTYFTAADLNKTYYGGGLKFGVTAHLGGNLWFETNIGTGVIGGSTWHQHMQGVTANSYGPPRSGFMGSDIGKNKLDDIEGPGIAFYIPFALRLTYHINRSDR